MPANALEVKGIASSSRSDFSAHRTEENTGFLFNFSALSERGRASHEAAGATFALDGILYMSMGSQIQLTVFDEKMCNICSEILHRKVFTLPVFQTNVASISPYIEPMTSVLRRFIGEVGNGNHELLLRNAMMENLVRHIAYVWPNTHSPELSLSPTDRPPLALRLALDYIYSKRGMVECVDDVASRTSVGVRALEKIFKDWLGIGIKRYCKIVTLRQISERIKIDKNKLSKIAQEYRMSNVTRLRREIEDYENNYNGGLYPWEIYANMRIGKTAKSKIKLHC